MMILSLFINDEAISLSHKPTLLWQGPYMLTKKSGVSSSVDMMSSPKTPSHPQMFSVLIVPLLKPISHPPDHPLTSRV